MSPIIVKLEMISLPFDFRVLFSNVNVEFMDMAYRYINPLFLIHKMTLIQCVSVSRLSVRL